MGEEDSRSSIVGGSMCVLGCLGGPRRRVSHKIPLCKLPPWESVPALRLECFKRCKDEKDNACVMGMKTEAKLQRWLLTRCKRELNLFYWFVYEKTDY